MKRLATILALLLSLVASSAHAEAGQASLDFSAFRQIPILHDGRVKPLESFARAYLLAFNGKDSLPDMTASAWLAELLFEPERDYKRAIFTIPSPDVVNALGLTLSAEHHYSFNDLSKAFETYGKTIAAIDALDDSQRTPQQRQLLELYSKVAAYVILSESLSLLQPRFHVKDADLAAELFLPRDKDLTFLDLMPHEAAILNSIDKLKRKKPADLTSQEKERAYLALDYVQISEHQQSSLFRILPPQWQADGDAWLSPWAAIPEGHSSPQGAAYMALWQEMGIAYGRNDTAAWDDYSAEARDNAYRLAGAHASRFRQRLEVLYLQADPFHIVLAIYLAAFAFLMIALFAGQRLAYRTAFALMIIGALIHASAIATRITIMDRPPVASLYETTLFVSFIAVFVALLFESRRRDMTGLCVGSLLGAVVVFISTRYAADGDTMEMLVAVLNTNFWLATHVVAITIGYGCALVAGTLGHLYLLNRLLRPEETASHAHIANTMLAAALIATFFATLGTILGGIWADQSWGRFWGWDPKENGAMLIVLWLLWLLHGKIANVLSPLTFATVAVLTNVVVALSWFGVNLLSVGLHSYGFTNHIAANLGLFCGGEILFAAGMHYALTKQKVRR